LQDFFFGSAIAKQHPSLLCFPSEKQGKTAMRRIGFFGLIALANSLAAALPPFHQSVKEMQALLSDPEFQDLFGSAEAISEIVRTEDGYEVATRTKRMRVDIRYRSLGRPGPVPFSFSFHEPVENSR